MHEFAAQVYIYLQFMLSLASATPTKERKVRTHRTTLYMKSIATEWPAIHRPSDWLRDGRLVSSWWWCENCIVFSDCSHSAPSLVISWSFALQNWATTSSIASHTGQWQTVLPLLFPSCAPQRGKEAYKQDKLPLLNYKPPPHILVVKSNRQKGEGRNVEWVW